MYFLIPSRHSPYLSIDQMPQTLLLQKILKREADFIGYLCCQFCHFLDASLEKGDIVIVALDLL